MVKKSQKKSPKTIFKDIGLVLLPLIVGFTSSLLTGNQMESFTAFNKPPLSPPGWLFPVVWTILYLLMGVASIFFFRKIEKGTNKKVIIALRTLYAVQLIFNFFWTIFFFGLNLFFFSFVWLVLLWGMILALLIMSYKNFRVSFWCLFPYILWVSFAGYLNIAIAVLN